MHARKKNDRNRSECCFQKIIKKNIAANMPIYTYKRSICISRIEHVATPKRNPEQYMRKRLLLDVTILESIIEHRFPGLPGFTKICFSPHFSLNLWDFPKIQKQTIFNISRP